MLTYQERLARRYPKINDQQALEIDAVRKSIWPLILQLDPWSKDLTRTYYDLIERALASAHTRYVEGKNFWRDEILQAKRMAAEFNLTIPGLAELAESQA